MSTFLRPIYKQVEPIELIEFALMNIELLFKNRMDDCIKDICENINIKEIMKLNKFIENSIAYNNIEILKFLINKYNIERININKITNSTTNEFINDTLNYLSEQNIKFVITDKFINKTIEYKKHDILKTIKNKVKLSLTNLITACKIGDDESINIILKDDMSIDDMFFLDDITQLNEISINEQCLEELCKNKHFDLFLKYSPSVISINNKILSYIGYYGHEESIKFIEEKFPEKIFDLFYYVCTGGHEKIISEMILKNENLISERAIHAICMSCSKEFIQKIYKYSMSKKIIDKESKIAGIVYKSDQSLSFYFLNKTLGITPEEKLRYLKEKVNKTKEQIKEIFNYEQLGDEWFRAREPIISSTNIGSILGHNKYENLFDMIKRKLSQIFEGNEATQYGNDTEIFSFILTYFSLCYEYIFKKKYDIIKQKEVGLKLWSKHPWIGASADGICNVYTENEKVKRITIELKSPFKMSFYEECPHYYYDQFTAAQIILGRNECKFCIFTPEKMQYNTYFVDEIYWKTEIFPELCSKYFDEILPRIMLKKNGLIPNGEINPVIVITE